MMIFLSAKHTRGAQLSAGLLGQRRQTRLCELLSQEPQPRAERLQVGAALGAFECARTRLAACSWPSAGVAAGSEEELFRRMGMLWWT